MEVTAPAAAEEDEEEGGGQRCSRLTVSSSELAPSSRSVLLDKTRACVSVDASRSSASSAWMRGYRNKLTLDVSPQVSASWWVL